MLHYVLLFTIQKVACESCILQGFSHSQRLALPPPARCRRDIDIDIVILENINIDMDIRENIDTDIDKGVLRNINIDEISIRIWHIEQG